MPEPVRKNHRYISGLDGLRAISVIAVILYHLHVSGIVGGYLGVTIFFVLSGYLITDLLVNEWEQYGTINLKNFWIRRFRRLIPALIIMLILVGFWITLFQRSFLAGLRSEVLAAVFYMSNWFYVVQDHSYFTKFSPPSPLQHMWSLAVEEQFYIIWPLVIIIALSFVRYKEKLALGTLGVALISAIVMAIMFTPDQDPSRVYYGTDTRAFSLLIGATLAFLWPSRKLKTNVTDGAKKLLDGAGLISFLLLLLMFLFMHEEGPFLYYGGMFFASIVTAVLIATIVHPASRVGNVLSFKPLIWVGVRSYGIYIWHFPLVVLMGAGIEGVGVPFWKSFLIITLTLLLAELSWRFVEDPVRKGEWKIWIHKFQTHEWSLNWKEWTLPYRIGSAFVGCIIIVFVMGMIFTPAQKQTNSEALEQHLKEEQKELERAKTEKHHNNEKAITQNNVTKEKTEVKQKSSVEVEAKQETNRKKIVAMDIPSSISVTAIGDSVMLSAASALKKQIPQIIVDAKVGRQAYEAIEVVNSLKQEGKLGKVVVLGLGSNGDFSEAQLNDLLQAIGDNRHIYLVNTRVPRNWQDNVNRKIRQAVKRHQNTKLIDWYSVTEGQYDLFYDDHIHPNQEGGVYYTALISSEIAKGEK
ncbi:acyltransferase family protein [Rummeliibacillus pycnus]|uniref:acyltransferase family protein n=1 Tax=Rummeliibacillus pycnus TaxID=101070 RepID=UPI000C9A5FAD|nr:acyltransferase family protein [Rummeliibacillus pycnus]